MNVNGNVAQTKRDDENDEMGNFECDIEFIRCLTWLMHKSNVSPYPITCNVKWWHLSGFHISFIESKNVRYECVCVCFCVSVVYDLASSAYLITHKCVYIFFLSSLKKCLKLSHVLNKFSNALWWHPFEDKWFVSHNAYTFIVVVKRLNMVAWCCLPRVTHIIHIHLYNILYGYLRRKKNMYASMYMLWKWIKIKMLGAI